MNNDFTTKNVKLCFLPELCFLCQQRINLLDDKSTLDIRSILHFCLFDIKHPTCLIVLVSFSYSKVMILP